MKLFLKTKDFAISQEAFELHHDASKDMLVTKPVPKDLTIYYDSEAYISHTDSSQGLVDKLYQWVKRFSLKRKLRLVESLSKKEKKLLDVGAGTADFLLTLKNEGWQVDGVEPNQKARARATAKGCILQKSLTGIDGQKFEIITLWHVLEHLPDLKNQISQLSALLQNDGTLVVAVPNFKSHDAIYYGAYWAAYDVPRHIWHFSKNAIKMIFDEHDFEVISTKPMLFDAFYVSLLSEKYKTGKQNLVKAFYVGLKSNIKALFTKEYSSHIYILKKRN